MVLSEYGYDNPFNSRDNRTEYYRYYYAFTKKLLSHDDCLRYVHNPCFRYSVTNYMKNRKQREQRGDELRGAIKEINTLKQELFEIKKMIKEGFKK